MFSTLLPPVMQMCASCGLVMTRSVLKRPSDLISSNVCDSCFSNSASIGKSQITQKKLIRKPGNQEVNRKSETVSTVHGFVASRFVVKTSCQIVNNC